MSDVAHDLAAVRARIERAASLASRDPKTIALVAVSKTKPAELVREAYAAGQRDFGENYAQELAEKADALADLEGIRWHFIGHLQSNKAKLVAPRAHAVHTIDSPSLAAELSKRAAAAGRKLDALVEVNVGGEAQKHGVPPQALGPVLEAIERQANLSLRGLMTVPPASAELARRAFEELARLREAHGGPTRLPELSMGMSDDLEIAVACGATIVRIGTAIFGARQAR